VHREIYMCSSTDTFGCFLVKTVFITHGYRKLLAWRLSLRNSLLNILTINMPP